MKLRIHLLAHCTHAIALISSVKTPAPDSPYFLMKQRRTTSSIPGLHDLKNFPLAADTSWSCVCFSSWIPLQENEYADNFVCVNSSCFVISSQQEMDRSEIDKRRKKIMQDRNAHLPNKLRKHSLDLWLQSTNQDVNINEEDDDQEYVECPRCHHVIHHFHRFAQTNTYKDREFYE